MVEWLLVFPTMECLIVDQMGHPDWVTVYDRSDAALK